MVHRFKSFDASVIFTIKRACITKYFRRRIWMVFVSSFTWPAVRWLKKAATVESVFLGEKGERYESVGDGAQTNFLCLGEHGNILHVCLLWFSVLLY